MSASPRIYALADAALLGEPLGETLPTAVTAMAGAGVGWIQFRAKPEDPLSDRRLYHLVEDTLEVLDGTGSELWINDRADLAAAFAYAALPVAGVHLGQTDLPPVAARRVVGDEVRIGLSTHDESQVEAAAADPDVDVVAVGPVFPTASKANPDPVVGLELLRFARRAIDRVAAEGRVRRKALVAIGGIGPRRVAEVLEAGADTAAVLSAACRPPVEERCHELVAAAEAWRPEPPEGVTAAGEAAS